MRQVLDQVEMCGERVREEDSIPAPAAAAVSAPAAGADTASAASVDTPSAVGADTPSAATTPAAATPAAGTDEPDGVKTPVATAAAAPTEPPPPPGWWVLKRVSSAVVAMVILWLALRTRLFLAAGEGDVAALEWLLTWGVLVNLRDEHDKTALMQASIFGQQGVMKSLIQAGAPIFRNDFFGADWCFRDVGVPAVPVFKTPLGASFWPKRCSWRTLQLVI